MVIYGIFTELQWALKQLKNEVRGEASERIKSITKLLISTVNLRFKAGER
jgi:hypothetical protein